MQYCNEVFQRKLTISLFLFGCSLVDGDAFLTLELCSGHPSLQYFGRNRLCSGTPEELWSNIVLVVTRFFYSRWEDKNMK